MDVEDEDCWDRHGTTAVLRKTQKTGGAMMT